MNHAPLSENHFQLFDLENSGFWKDVAFEKHDDQFFSEQIIKLSALFDQVVTEGGLISFAREYVRCSRLMLQKSQERELVRQILVDGLRRLVMTHRFLARRTRNNLNEPGVSVRHWAVDMRMIQAAREQASLMEQQNIMVQDFDLDQAPDFKKWLMDTVQPVIASYVGAPVIKPWAQIRYADAARHGHEWNSIYERHAYGYFHFDELWYALPTIVYLDDVDEECGPFSYVDGSDKLPQNYVLRALHQAVGHHCKINPIRLNERALMGRLPGPLRGGDLVGAFADPAPFEVSDVRLATGAAGTVSLFEGFRLTHAGGHPKAKSRKALFVAFRYPTKKIDGICAWMAKKYAHHAIR